LSLPTFYYLPIDDEPSQMEPNNLLGGLDLDNPMSGLDARSDVEFKEGPCIVAEIRRDSVRSVPSDLNSTRRAL
jgi:hypothetical protein